MRPSGSAARRAERTPMLAVRAVLLFLLAAASPAASSAAASSAETQEPSGNAIQQRGGTAWSKCPLGSAPVGACALSGCAWSLWTARYSQEVGRPTHRAPSHRLGWAEPTAIAVDSTPLTIQEATRRRPSRSPYRSQAQCLGAARRRPTTRRNDEPAWTGTASSRSYVQGLAPRHRLRHRHRRPSPANATRRAAMAPCATTGAGSACTTTSGAGFARAGGRRARAASTRERGRLTTRSLQTAST